MTLTYRMTTAFVLALLLVLAGFSVSMYALASIYLRRQSAHQLDAVLNTVLASIETKPDRVEYEPEERTLIVPDTSAPIQWLLTDDKGHPLGGSDESNRTFLLSDFPESLAPRVTTDKSGRTWLIGTRWILPTQSPKDAVRLRHQLLGAGEFPSLWCIAAVPLASMQSALSRLALTLAAVSLAILTAFSFVARTVCRRILLPVTQMAARAQEIHAHRLSERIPPAHTGDEIDDLCRSFNDLLDRLQISFQRQARFTGDASHQLRTPLTAIRGQLEIALRHDRTAAEYREVLGKVLDRTVHLQRIVESLLFLARSDEESASLQREPIDLTAWVRSLPDAWAYHERGTDLDIVCENSAPFWVNAHPVLLQELLSVLISNAFSYSPPKTPVVVRLDHSDDDATIRVEDAGIGIDPSEVDRIFEPFFRSTTGMRLSPKGVGLGLVIAKRLADAIGVVVTVEMRSKPGSVFAIHFPRQSSPPVREQMAMSHSEPCG